MPPDLAFKTSEICSENVFVFLGLYFQHQKIPKIR